MEEGRQKVKGKAKAKDEHYRWPKSSLALALAVAFPLSPLIFYLYFTLNETPYAR